MKTNFSKYEYLEAKAFLADARILRAFHNANIYSSVTYIKPDGSIWYESESHLEAPENDYSLTMKTDQDAPLTNPAYSVPGEPTPQIPC